MLFHIRFRTDFAALGRLYRYLLLLSPRILILNALYLALCSLFASYFFFSGDLVSGLMVAGIFLLYATMILLRYLLSFSNHKKRIRECYHQEFVDSEYRVYPEAILTQDSTGANVRLDYESIRFAKDRPEEILLATKAKLVYVLPKTGFVQGSPEDFLLFLRSRSVKVKQ